MALAGADGAARSFLEDLRAQAAALRETAERARVEHADAAVRLAEAESKLADSLHALRALETYTGLGSEVGSSLAGSEDSTPQAATPLTVDTAIVQALRGAERMKTDEIAERVVRLGATHSAGGVRTRLTALTRKGVLQRVAKGYYRLPAQGGPPA
ncbi:hypothetical protein AB0C76_10720 [Kitasatospora sp. NPDC048722]|uniref:hypothetical protein n=1 Tax=Kitasatospora sp. NPDC048722 TaxID=3155639 RepID=UPI0033D561BF